MKTVIGLRIPLEGDIYLSLDGDVCTVGKGQFVRSHSFGGIRYILATV